MTKQVLRAGRGRFAKGHIVPLRWRQRFSETTKYVINPDMVKELYLKQRLSICQIANVIKCDDETVRRRMKQWGIPRRNIVRTMKTSPSPELSYVLGVIFGDGNVAQFNGSCGIFLGTIDEDFAEAFAFAISKISSKSCKVYRDKCGDWLVRAYSINFGRWFFSMSRAKLFGVASLFPKEFIRGFFDSEGSVDKRGLITVSNTNNDILLFISKLLESTFQITNKVRLMRQIKSKKYEYRLMILRLGDAQKYMKKISFTIKRKEVRLVEAFQNR